MAESAQRRLAAFIAGCASVDIPEAAREIARQSLLDSLAVAFAGRREAVHGRVSGYATAVRQPEGALSWLDGFRYLPETAALLNGVAVHALDYDDVTPAWRGHPGAVLWPALCATCEGVPGGRTYNALLDAFVLGFEVGAQVGAAVRRHHYAAGWHATSTVGVIAAAAACARALQLDAEAVFHALGLAVAQSAGLQGNFGSMAKPLQAGFSAGAAVRAVLLARAGVEAADVLEGRNGFASLYGDTQTLPLALDEFRSRPAIASSGIEVKQFPNCYATHRAVEAALLLRREIGDAPSAVRAIHVEGTPGAHQALLRRLPSQEDEARFSVEFAVASALVDGGVWLGSFAPGALSRDEIRHLMSRTDVCETESLGKERAARVVLELVDGGRLERVVSALPGRFGEVAFMGRLRDKVVDCLSTAALGTLAEPLYRGVLSTPGDADGTAAFAGVLADVWRVHGRAINAVAQSPKELS